YAGLWWSILLTRYTGQCNRMHIVSRTFPFKAVWTRRTSILRRTGKIDKPNYELSQYFHRLYTDLNHGLDRLAGIHATCSHTGA
ncbi:hypothetical protein J3R82DRAFT_7267, partial [Butyriboletus roseoflavus]